MLARMPTVSDEIREYNRMATARARKAQPIDATLPAEAKGSWLILKVAPNHEGIVAGHLVARQFGLFLPQYPSSYVSRGRKRTTLRCLFPGYVFVFVWDTKKHAKRLLSIPGVTGLVWLAPEIPMIVPDHIINAMRAEENRRRPFTYTTASVITRRPRRKSKSGAAKGKPVTSVVVKEHQVHPDDIVSVQCASFWEPTLDERQRITMLHVALGLASQHS